jgi:hypothetical protein
MIGGTSSIDLAQLSSFHLTMETEFSLRNAMGFKQNRMMDNVQEHINLKHIKHELNSDLGRENPSWQVILTPWMLWCICLLKGGREIWGTWGSNLLLLKRLVAAFPPRRAGFEPGSGHVGFVVDKVALG